MSVSFAIIGGSGLYSLGDDFQIESAERIQTPYGAISAELEIGELRGFRVAFLPRHGRSHNIPPHRINYRANLWAIKQVGVSQVIGANAVGGIGRDYAPQTIALPDQIIDYTSNREHSYFDGENEALNHVDFTWPYSKSLRSNLRAAAGIEDIDLVDGGTYGCTNGPRLETAAEIQKMKADGCDMIGMTGMPEAALARELGMEYASVALIVNWCAGLDDTEICMEQIKLVLEEGVERIRRLILAGFTEVNG